jgi:hypothetical protein
MPQKQGTKSNIFVDLDSLVSGNKLTKVSYHAGIESSKVFSDPTENKSAMINQPTPESVVSSFAPAPYANVRHNDHCIDMSMAISSDGMRGIIKECVKPKLFLCVKFFDREKHGFYSENLNTAICNIVPTSQQQEALAWWREIRPVVIRTISDHRNNCIKSMRTRYFRKYFRVCLLLCRAIN